MAADSPVKEAMVKTAVVHLLRTAKRDPERTARNVTELACVLTHRNLVPEEETLFLSGMARFIREGNEKEALSLVQQFFFPNSNQRPG